MLYERVVEVEERVTPEWIEHVDDPSKAPEGLGDLVEGVNGAKLRIVEVLSEFLLYVTTSSN